MLFAQHERAPQWWWDFPFKNVTVDGVGVVILEFRDLELHTQLRIMSTARGLISIEGAAFTQQFFLQPMSPVYIMSSPMHIDPFRRECWNWPETWHDITGIHLGHTVFHWRFCGDGDEFQRLRPDLTLKFLLRKNEEARRNKTAWFCSLLSPPANITSIADAKRESEWPYCTFSFSLPIAGPFRQCGAFGNVGFPFISEENRAEMVDSKIYPFTSTKQPDICCAEPYSLQKGSCNCHTVCRKNNQSDIKKCRDSDSQGVRPLCKPSDCQEPIDNMILEHFDFR